MAYQFERKTSIFSELEHVEWFLKHKDQYRFEAGTEDLKKLEESISRKNVYYSTTVDTYSELVSQFDNSPYNYMTGLQGKRGYNISSDQEDCYFVEWNYGRDTCMAPIGFLKDHIGESGITEEEVRVKQINLFNHSKYDCKQIVDQVKTYTEDALKASDGYRDLYIDSLAASQKRQRKDAFALFAAWIALLLAMGSHPWFNKVFYTLHLAGRPAMSGKGGIVGGVLLLVMLAAMIVFSRQTWIKGYLVRRMGQIVKHAKEFTQYRNVPWTVRSGLEQEIKGRIVQDVHVDELSELVRLSGTRYSFGKFSSIAPETYPYVFPGIAKACIAVIVVSAIMIVVL